MEYYLIINPRSLGEILFPQTNYRCFLADFSKKILQYFF